MHGKRSWCWPRSSWRCCSPKRTIGKRAVNLAARTLRGAPSGLPDRGLPWQGRRSRAWKIQFALSSLHTLASSGAIFYWLRPGARHKHHGGPSCSCSPRFIVSEVEIYLCLLLPPVAADLTALALVCVQYPLHAVGARARPAVQAGVAHLGARLFQLREDRDAKQAVPHWPRPSA